MSSFEFMQSWDGNQAAVSEAERFQVCRDFFMETDQFRKRYAVYEEEMPEQENESVILLSSPTEMDAPELEVSLRFVTERDIPVFTIVTPSDPREEDRDKRYGRQYAYYYDESAGAILRGDSFSLIAQILWMMECGLIDTEIQGDEEPEDFLLGHPEVLRYFYISQEASREAGVNYQPIDYREMQALKKFMRDCEPTAIIR